MGFLDGLSRFVQGKPIFETPSSPSDPAPQSNSQPGGPKQLPQVEVEEIDIHNSGTHTRIIARIANRSDRTIELDKIHFLGGKRELDTWLRPGEERELIVFEGNRPTHRNYDDAYIDYKDESGDYFQAQHVVEFEAQDTDGTYEVRRIRFVGSVKDI